MQRDVNVDVGRRYELLVGRSTDPTSGFVDRDGRALDDGEARVCDYTIEGEEDDCAGGTKFLVGDAATGVIGPGHAGVFDYTNRVGAAVAVFTFHYYDLFDGGAAKLGARRLTFDDAGWPVLGDVWDVCDFTGCDPAAVSTTCTGDDPAVTTRAPTRAPADAATKAPVLEAATPAPTPAEADGCEDDPTWHKKNKPDQDCAYFEEKNEKAKWDKKTAKKNCKKKSEDKVKAKTACKCKACDKERFKKTKDADEASVVIAVPICVAAVLLAAGAVWLARRRVVASKQHRRESMPDASERSLHVGED